MKKNAIMSLVKNRPNVKTLILLTCTFTAVSFAGQKQKWEEVPEAVRKTILANGGSAEGQVDKEGAKIDGKVVYEAVGKDKKGNEVDLVVNEDGKLVMTKDDDIAADRAAEQSKRGKNLLAKLKFTHPLDINNPYLPLSTLQEDILEGKEGSKTVRIERKARPDKHRTFKIGKQTVEALAIEDREIENGELAEVAIDYFAQADDGTVCYLGEEVDEYKNGKISSHEGSWMLGQDTKTPGVILPGNPKIGDKFKSEDVSKEIHENDEVVSVSETVTTPAGTYQNCVKVKEVLVDGDVEFKYYAKGVGVVRESPKEGDVLLKSHQTK